jgi:hypothetical protein
MDDNYVSKGEMAMEENVVAMINFNVHWSSISSGKSFKERHSGPHFPPRGFGQNDHCSISFVITNNRFGLHFM